MHLCVFFSQSVFPATFFYLSMPLHNVGSVGGDHDNMNQSSVAQVKPLVDMQVPAAREYYYYYYYYYYYGRLLDRAEDHYILCMFFSQNIFPTSFSRYSRNFPTRCG